MKKIICFCIMMVTAINLFAQKKDVTTFLGIPVDGSKYEMKRKLMAKGFIPQEVGTKNEHLKGEFNGTDVNIYIVTNNNKVYRIMVGDANTQDEANIKIRFNKLVSQFENNKRYISLDKYTLSDDENISYEMKLHNKVYDAIYYQAPQLEHIDSLAMQQQISEKLLGKYTKEQLTDPTKKEEIIQDIQNISIDISFDLMSKKPVWFRISELSYGEYYIVMYYDNEYNMANGEDL